jgi:two-component system nitrogen regulation sensor histidine kinase NtrY
LSRRGVGAAVGRATVISIGEEVRPARRARLTSDAAARSWTVVTAAALVTAALWLRTPELRYLAPAAIATVIAAMFLRFVPRRLRLAGGATVVVLGVFCVAGTVAQRELARIEGEWSAYRAERVTHGAQRLNVALDSIEVALSERAHMALEVPNDTLRAFAHLERLVSEEGPHAIAVYDNGRSLAWAGRARVRTDSVAGAAGVIFTPFYVTLYAAAERGERRAVASTLVHAEPPADRLAHAVDERLAARARLHGFQFVLPTVRELPESMPYVGRGGDTLFRGRPLVPAQGEAALLALDRARERGAALLAVAMLFFLAASWARLRPLTWRLITLAVALACLGLVPLGTFSSDTSLFDPAVYSAKLGGPFTASVGALALSSAMLLLALLSVLRTHVRASWRLGAMAIVAIVMSLGPFLLRDLARGVTVPASGITVGLWLAWQVALFLAAAALLLGAAAAGGAVLGATRGLHPAIAPGLAGLAALVGPIVWDAPGRWPGWYPVLWIAAIGALALTRRHAAFILTAATVAAFGAATLTWGAGVRGRVALANDDVGELAAPDPYPVALLERLADSIEAGRPPLTEAELLRRFVRSDLSGAGYPVALSSWLPDGLPGAVLSLTPADVDQREVGPVVTDARTRGTRIVRVAPSVPGTNTILAVPHEDGTVTAVVVQPRTRLIPDDPFYVLLGLEPRERGEPPYSLALVDVDTRGAFPSAGETRWYRDANELHGDRIIATPNGPARAHIEVDLRSLDLLVQRGTLVVLVDLVLLLGLWTLSVTPGGAFGRWLRVRRLRWSRSYRARLTVALFLFFVIPAATFALWSYRRLQDEVRQSRELLVRETLRAGAGAEDLEKLELIGDRLQTPLFLYRDGALRRASTALHESLAAISRFLPRDVHIALSLGGEVNASRVVSVGGVPTLVGYRLTAGPSGERDVLAAPARGGEVLLERRRRDLGVLVMFATVLGAVAALGLSGFAARSLARPIGSLQGAALAIAGGEREPQLTGVPPEEFVPVFSAFRRMAADLGESRAALEETQRRIAAILRNVASGVIAVDRSLAVTLANPAADALLAHAIPPATRLEGVAPPELVARARSFLQKDADEEEFDASLGQRQLHVRLTRLTRGVGGAVITLDDVTDLARAQRVLAWGEMARQVAHEIKNPLTPIRLGVQHLRRARADARADFDAILDQNVARILAEIDRLDEIARSFSRYGTAPTERPSAEPTDVAAVVRDVVELERLGRDEIEWRATGVDTPVFAFASEDELREVMINLLENARLARARRVEMRVMADGDRVHVHVRDDGHGIAPEVLPRIFEPHFSTRTSGSGLGLAISRQLLEGWGGTIQIENAPGGGALVRITMRRAA